MFKCGFHSYWLRSVLAARYNATIRTKYIPNTRMIAAEGSAMAASMLARDYVQFSQKKKRERS